MQDAVYIVLGKKFLSCTKIMHLDSGRILSDVQIWSAIDFYFEHGI